MLSTGAKLGPYEILGPLGAGGMGEVYRARDAALNRDVALKILPQAFAADPDRLARFTREAQTLAALNHPHIAHIYGLERQEGREGQDGHEARPAAAFIVMELVDGEDLSQRLARGAVPIDEALPIAKQIADALEAAHEQGIIHRDLKPANIKVRSDGTVKVLDFGLAKAMDPAASSASAATLANSPTLTSPAALTAAGMILGTAAYMSPEQARGKTVDKRSDIWSFGAVLFELLTGTRAFAGGEVTDTLAFILTRDADWNALPAGTPRSIRRLLRRCLEKDPRRRLHDIADARLEIDEALGVSPNDTAPAASAKPATIARWLPWAAVGALALALAAVTWAPWRATVASPTPMTLSAELGAEGVPDRTLGASTVLSPDGTVLAFVTRASGSSTSLQLYVRRLNQLKATQLAGSDGANSPFFSPDGQWIAFFATGKLKKVPVVGGTVVTLCDAPSGRGAAWAEDGTIVFSPNSQSGTILLRVSASGGTPEPVTTLADGEVTHRWPQVLPGGKTVLYTSSTSAANLSAANLVVQALPNGARKIVQRAGYYGRYLPSGHIVYIHDGRLFAAPFDLDRLEETGPSVPALEHVVSLPATGGAQFHAAATGTLVYQEGQNAGNRPIHWMDRDGKVTSLRATPAIWFNPRFAPDGHRLALQILEAQSDIWIDEWDRDTLTRLTSDPADDTRPTWTPDSQRIAFASVRGDRATLNLYWQLADGTGGAQRLTESKNSQVPGSWHPTGRLLAFEERILGTRADLMILPIEGDEASGWKPGRPTVFLNNGGRDPTFSPDGHWIAYTSTESGHDEVYVRPFPGPGGKWQISTGGGAYPTWSRTKREIFYAATGGQIMVASFVADGNAFRADRPRSWSDRHFVEHGGNRSFDLHPDGQRFALEAESQTTGPPTREHITFVFNFFDELRRIAPTGRR